MSKKIITSTTTRQLPVRLTDDELLVFGKKLVKSMRESATAEGARKSENDKRKAAIEKIEEETQRIAGVVQSGEEVRDVTCEVTKNFDSRTVTVTRTDTGEFVEERIMTEAERQESLFDDADAKVEHAERKRRGPKKGDPLEGMGSDDDKPNPKDGNALEGMDNGEGRNPFDSDGDPLSGMEQEEP
jgi:hypothetical protein